MTDKASKRITGRSPADAAKPDAGGRMTKSGRHRIPEMGRKKPAKPEIEHEGGTDAEVGDRTGPGAGYDQEPDKAKDKGGVA
jgi:hypothetical protein